LGAHPHRPDDARPPRAGGAEGHARPAGRAPPAEQPSRPPGQVGAPARRAPPPGGSAGGGAPASRGRAPPPPAPPRRQPRVAGSRSSVGGRPTRRASEPRAPRTRGG